MPARARAGLILAATLIAAGCANQTNAAPTGATTTLRSCGTEITVPRPPKRVVTLDQPSTETLIALGVADRMVGTANLKTKVAPQYADAYGKIPVLNPKYLTSEQLRAATPDFAVAASAELFTKDRAGTRAELGELGLPAYVSGLDCPKDNDPGLAAFDLLFRDFENFGRIFGVEDRATAMITEQRAVLRRASDARAGLIGTPSVAYLYSTAKGIPYVAGRTGLPNEMSRLLGVRNVFDDVADDWPEVSWEELAKRNPDVIVIGDLAERGLPGDSAADKIDLMRRDPVMSQLKAVRDNRFIIAPGVELDPTVRSVNALRVITDGLRTLGHVR
ncbi:iron complex transport system substrate-binding protein [Herbihabitans rhizosphaerae]|uniref:Iron complex transport system substrate-binding protein n=1 Tax=Herbihabitans rhizosphaerae TaxID=1872711 RepID=A0A4Q7L2Q4_9PSEU|nr:ABC transporter substrate-binding protein [Herbihabitans rhizosphaerae]RZS43507.1 iron complex transport system substrate-binding protein [Herbihabitans rhizosphaerae]